MGDYDNWDDERGSIIDDTLDTLRDQRDDAQKLEDADIITYNPQVFVNTTNPDTTVKPSSSHYLLGPVQFKAPFTKTPVITFGQTAQQSVNSDVSPEASSYVPFLVIPYVYQWTFSNSSVDGFWLGMYALSSPPSNIISQTVHWRAVGEGSPYLDQMQEDAWIEPYDANSIDFLSIDDDSTDDSTSDGGWIDGGDDGDLG